MKIVLDTCCLIATGPAQSLQHWFWRAFRKRLFVLCVTTEILEEYEEVLTRIYSTRVAKRVLRQIMTATNIQEVNVYYNWRLIIDPDDNKFSDCAFAANAHFIVTHDRHFNKLKDNFFPQFTILTLEQFLVFVQGQEGGDEIFFE
jgi:putative PIN family toxin of toxin-antitoxin system